MDRNMALQYPAVGPATVRILTALRGSEEKLCPPEVLLCYEVTFDRQFSRDLTRLLLLQASQTNQPAGQTWKEENIAPAKRTPETVEHKEQAVTETRTSDVGQVANLGCQSAWSGM
jgi:hypothetical protein